MEQSPPSPPTSPEVSRRSVSPATSTPGQHQVLQMASSMEANAGNTPAKFRYSELSESDESAIIDSPNGNESTILYEKPGDDTTIQEKNPEDSCVADRTRAKSSLSGPSSNIAFNLSSIMEHMKNEAKEMEKTNDKEEELEFELETLQSLPLPTWIGCPFERNRLWESLQQIDNSIKKIEKIDKAENVEGEMDKFTSLSEAVLDRSRNINFPETCTETTEE